jgi:hypothetical protein
MSETETENAPTVTEPVAAPEEEAPEPDTGDELEDEEEEQAEPSEPEPEEELEAEGEVSLSMEEGERASKEAEKYWKTAGPNILSKWGAYGQKYFFECPLCPTQHKGFIDQNLLGRIPDQQQTLVKRVLGITAEIEYVQDEETRTCPRCEGYGQTSTGSKVPTQLKHTCSLCAGYGFVPPPSGTAHPSPSGALPDNGTSPVLAPPVDDFGKPDVDNWQEPRILPDGRENPNYGRQPSFKVLVDPWGITAGLGAQDA